MARKSVEIIIFSLVLMSCASKKIQKDPNWVEMLRSNMQTIKVSGGNRVLYRALHKGSSLSDQNRVCQKAIHRAKNYIYLEFPNSKNIPITLEYVYWSNRHKDCSVTVSISKYVKDNSDALEQAEKKIKKLEYIIENTKRIYLTSMSSKQKEYISLLNSEKAKAEHYARLGLKKPQFEDLMESKVDIEYNYKTACKKNLGASYISRYSDTLICWSNHKNANPIILGHCIGDRCIK